MWSNVHTHSTFCDGKGGLADYVEAARKLKMKTLGFSSHAPIPSVACKWCMENTSLAQYLDEIESLKTSATNIELYKGLEIDFIPGVVKPSDYAPLLDYSIGSIHFVDSFESIPWEIDGSHAVFKEGLEKIFKNDIQGALIRYFELTREMIQQSAPDIIGHLDKIKIQNKAGSPFDESALWYRDEIDKTLNLIKDADAIIEVNTRGIYQKKSAVTYPSPWILEMVLEKRIRITLSSDAHHPDDLVNEFETTASLLNHIGFKNLSILMGGKWKQMPFNQYGIII
jgi:histidinol-phosphatase (PHP family)